jgi:jouberin
LDNLDKLYGVWNEKFVYNQSLESIMSPDVVLIFEIIETFVRPTKHGFIPIAWAFLRLKQQKEERDGEDFRNMDTHVDRRCRLQLHYYPSQTFDVTIRQNRVPAATLITGRKKCRASLTVEVRPSETVATEPLIGRPEHVFHLEKSGETLGQLIGRSEDEADTKATEEEKKQERLRKKKEKREIRPANRNCQIPTDLASQFPAGEHGALALQFNKNGDALAVAVHDGTDYVIQMYSVTAFDKYATLRGHHDLIYELQFSDDDSLLLSVSADQTAKVWKGYGHSGESKRYLKQTLKHSTCVYSGKFHPDDNRLVVTAGQDGLIRVWSRVKEIVALEFPGHETRVNSISFSPDGKNLFAGDGNGVISVWYTGLENGLEGFKRLRFVREEEIAKVSVEHVEMGRSNFSLMVYSRDNMVRIFETKVMVPSQRYSGALCKSYHMMATFSPDGQYILAGSENGTVVLWTVRKAEVAQVPKWKFRFEYPVTAVAWNRVENMIAISSFGEGQPVLVFAAPVGLESPKDDLLL